MIKLGFHTSIAGSVLNAPAEAVEFHYTAFQLFVSSSRSWKHSAINGDDAEKFREIVKRNALASVAHVPYLCNPSSTNPEVYKKSREMLVGNLENCKALGVPGLVIHIGSHLGKGLDIGIQNAIDAITFALDRCDETEIYLENTAGYNHSVGSKFSEIGRIIKGVGSDRLGVCLDTCHAFAAGYDLRTDESIAAAMKEFDREIGSRRLKVVHLNDSKHELGSGLDRHWHIGKGFIGRDGFIALFRNKNFKSGTFIMETPVNGDGDEAYNFSAATEIIREAQEDD